MEVIIMANELDETREKPSIEGRDVFVIQKQIPVQPSSSANILEILCWCLLAIPVLVILVGGVREIAPILISVAIGILPGFIWFLKKKGAMEELQRTQQKVQAAASQIDNYIEQRMVILQNAAKLLDKAIELDKDTLKTIAAYRSGVNPDRDNQRNEITAQIDKLANNIKVAFESYPNLEAHNTIADAMQQNAMLQKQITAARELYNDVVLSWNSKIFQWPIYIQVASKAGYTTRIPYSASQEIKDQARGVFF